MYRIQIDTLNQELSYIKQYLYNAETSQDGSAHPQIMQDFEDASQTRSLRRARSGFESLKSLEEPHNLFAEIQANNDSIQ